MASRGSRKSGFPEFFADVQSSESVRRQFIEAPMDAARGPALGSLLELAGLMTTLPEAFVASQQRELDRLEAARGADDPRVQALRASIDRAAALRVTAARGEARFQRALVALADSEDALHGFVSGADLAPLDGVTVRLDRRDAAGKPLSAQTDSDGYFRIPLGTTRDAQKKRTGKTTGDMAGRVAEILGRMSRVTAAGATTEEKEEGPAEQASVEIVSKGKVLHRDPVPIRLGRGAVYREYVVPASGPASPADVDQYVAKKGRAAKASTRSVKRAKATTRGSGGKKS